MRILKLIAFALFAVNSTYAQAHSCRVPLMNEHTRTLLFPEATELENERGRFTELANYVLSSTDEEFFVYGTFYPLTDLPLLHSMKTYDSSANIKKEAAFVPVEVDYTYSNAIGFAGVRFINGKTEPFQTERTIISITVYFDGATDLQPEFHIPVVGKLSQIGSSGLGYEIPTQPCPSFFKRTKYEVQVALDCAAGSGPCRPDFGE